MNRKWWIGGSIIALTVGGLSFMQLKQATVYFFTPEEAYARGIEFEGRVIKIGGLVKPDSVQKPDPSSLETDFIVTDLQNHEIAVSYRGVLPDMFKAGSGVVVEGKLDPESKRFKASQLMVKHSEEYKSPDNTKAIDHTMIQKSLFKDSGTAP